MLANESELTQERQQRKYSLEERNNYVEAWKLSGLSQSEFCRREGLSVQRFGYWSRKPQTKKKTKPGLSFLPLDISRQLSPAAAESRIEIQLKNGLRCSFTHFSDVTKLLEIIEGLSHVAVD